MHSSLRCAGENPHLCSASLRLCERNSSGLSLEGPRRNKEPSNALRARGKRGRWLHRPFDDRHSRLNYTESVRLAGWVLAISMHPEANIGSDSKSVRFRLYDFNWVSLHRCRRSSSRCRHSSSNQLFTTTTSGHRKAGLKRSYRRPRISPRPTANRSTPTKRCNWAILSFFR
jgi:hypothetical protein